MTAPCEESSGEDLAPLLLNTARLLKQPKEHAEPLNGTAGNGELCSPRQPVCCEMV